MRWASAGVFSKIPQTASSRSLPQFTSGLDPLGSSSTMLQQGRLPPAGAVLPPPLLRSSRIAGLEEPRASAGGITLLLCGVSVSGLSPAAWNSGTCRRASGLHYSQKGARTPAWSPTTTASPTHPAVPSQASVVAPCISLDSGPQHSPLCLRVPTLARVT